jgi:hypothetical protein
MMIYSIHPLLLDGLLCLPIHLDHHPCKQVKARQRTRTSITSRIQSPFLPKTRNITKSIIITLCLLPFHLQVNVSVVPELEENSVIDVKPTSGVCIKYSPTEIPDAFVSKETKERHA